MKTSDILRGWYGFIRGLLGLGRHMHSTEITRVYRTLYCTYYEGIHHNKSYFVRSNHLFNLLICKKKKSLMNCNVVLSSVLNCSIKPNTFMFQHLLIKNVYKIKFDRLRCPVHFSNSTWMFFINTLKTFTKNATGKEHWVPIDADWGLVAICIFTPDFQRLLLQCYLLKD